MVDLRNKKLNIIFLGTTNFSKKLLDILITNGFIPKAIFSIPQEFNISYSDKKIKNYNYANLRETADKHRISYYEVNSIKEEKVIADYYDEIKKINPDIILVLGWYYMIPNRIRNLSKCGAWGIHSSLLPKYAGGAPLNWAILNGEDETGVTLFKMDDGVDTGDIIYQKRFKINFNDTIKEVYENATKESEIILLKALNNIDNLVFTQQDKSKRKVYPQRKPEDGEINLAKTSLELYNFIRAQSDPYPGAFIKTVDGKKLIIEKARIEEL